MLQPEAMDDEQRRLHSRMSGGPRGHVAGPLALWLHRPPFCEHAERLGVFCRFGSTLSKLQPEIVVLAVAHSWRSEFVATVHKNWAVDAGLSSDQVESILAGEPAAGLARADAALHEFARQLFETGRADQAIYAEALECLGQDCIFDMIGLVGYYTMMSMTANIFQVDCV